MKMHNKICQLEPFFFSKSAGQHRRLWHSANVFRSVCFLLFHSRVRRVNGTNFDFVHGIHSKRNLALGWIVLRIFLVQSLLLTMKRSIKYNCKAALHTIWNVTVCHQAVDWKIAWLASERSSITFSYAQNPSPHSKFIIRIKWFYFMVSDYHEYDAGNYVLFWRYETWPNTTP